MKSRKLVFLFAAAMMLALTYVPSASAGGKTIWENPENPCNKASLSAGIRYRYEMDSRSGDDVDGNGIDDAVEGDTDANGGDRNRQRIRLRLGFKVMTGSGVTAAGRITTNTGSLDSANQTLSGFTGGYGVGFDRAYVKYKSGGFWIQGGKNGNPAKQLSGAWFNGNFNPEGISLGFGTAAGDGKFNLSLAQFIVAEKNWIRDGDDTAIQAALHWGGKVGGIKLDVAATNLTVTDTAPGADSDAFTLFVVGVGMGPIKGGIEYFTSDIDTGDSDDKVGMVVNVRYKINDMLGVRAYFYDMGAASAPIPQTDFPESSNFTGTRIQLDVKAAGVNMDFRYYTQSVKNDNITPAIAAAIAPGNGYMHSGLTDHTRMQANFVVSF